MNENTKHIMSIYLHLFLMGTYTTYSSAKTYTLTKQLWNDASFLGIQNQLANLVEILSDGIFIAW